MPKTIPFSGKHICVRVRIDVRLPLKLYKKFKTMEGFSMKAIFRYERMSIYCFVCGIIGHGEKSCPKVFALVEANQEVVRGWGPDLRVQMGRTASSGNTWWLRDEQGGGGAVAATASEARVDPPENPGLNAAGSDQGNPIPVNSGLGEHGRESGLLPFSFPNISGAMQNPIFHAGQSSQIAIVELDLSRVECKKRKTGFLDRALVSVDDMGSSLVNQ